MKLNVQIISFISSFLYGFIFYYLIDFFNKFIKEKKIIVNIVLSFFFVLLNSFLYFILLLVINNGYVHIYFLLSILCGYLFANYIMNKWFTHKNKNSKM